MGVISVRGAGEHNLRDISVDIPKNKLVSFTGVSGSGKTSLVFDTIYVEAFRRFAGATAAPVYLMGNTLWAQTTRPKYRALTGLPPALGLSQQQGVAGKLSTVGTLSGASDLLRVYFAAFGDVYCRNCDIPLRPSTYVQVMDFLFRDLPGKTVSILAPIAEKRKGGFEKEIEKFRQLGFSRIRINGSNHDLQDDTRSFQIDAKKLNTIDVVVDHVAIANEKKKRIERAILQAIEHGKGVVKVESTGTSGFKFNTSASCPQCGESSPQLDPRYFSHSSLGQCEKCAGTGADHEEAPADLFPCRTCHGTRLSRTRPIVRVHNETFETLHGLNLDTLITFLNNKLIPDAQGDKAKMRVADELIRLTKMLKKIGLEHLNLNRSGMSLSPGDLQRLRLASMLSNKLTGALYVLDEPCQGLTAKEVDNLAAVLRELVADGASVVAVEHHPVFLRHSDEIFVMGPGAGIHGGQIVERTTGSRYGEHIDSLDFKKQNSSAKQETITFKDVEVRNLKKKEISLPQGAITILRGPAGHGKSSFLELCLFPGLECLLNEENPKTAEIFSKIEATPGVKITSIADVRPGSLMRTSRRSVAAALDVIAPLREIFSKLPASQVLGLSEAHFSFFSKHGRCENCEGRGYVEIPQRFGSPVRVTCETCLGARLTSKSLVPRYKGYNFADMMQLSIEEALGVFAHTRMVANKLSVATEFGLGYVKLGQGMDSLSGGELQRLTLTMELRRSTLAGAWFILVHPGTGLHAPDIHVLGKLMRLMVDKGATFVVLENREEFQNYADKTIEF